jgi:anti-sigma B factor antagonist
MEVREIDKGVAVVSLPEGIIRGENYEGIKHRIESLIGTGQVNIVVDLTKIRDINSTGVGVFISLSKKISMAKGTLKLANPQPFVMDVFNITGLNNVFEIYNSVNDALATYR